MTKRVDVVIAGSGAAGMLAAIRAAESGLSCVLLEKGRSIASSNAARCGGPALAQTRLQEREGETVTAERLFSHMYGFSRGTVNAGLLRAAIDKGREAEAIFVKNGLRMTLLEDSYGVGFRARHFFLDPPVKRWTPLADAFRAAGGELLFEREAFRVLLSGGKAAGLLARNLRTGEEERYEADAVIVATGGFLGSDELLRAHFGDIFVNPLGSRLSDGAGLRMLTEAGGMEERAFGICANEFGGSNHLLGSRGRRSSPHLRYAVYGGLLLNRQGRRFVNEQLLSDHALSAGGEAALREGVFYALLDGETYARLQTEPPYRVYGEPEEWHVGKRCLNTPPDAADSEGELRKDIEEGWAFRAESLSALAAQTGLTALPETVAAYNAACRAGHDGRFGKAPYLLREIGAGPYTLFQYEPSAWCTFGGVRTDAFCRVLTRAQEPIPGLYAAGVDAGSCYTVPYYDNEGAAVGLAFGLGLVAADDAVRYCREAASRGKTGETA